MASKRDHLFPSTSIGRSQGSRLQRVDSHDSLTAHPLLTSNRSSSPLPDQAIDGAPRYVPYTPRQRVTLTAVTTGTTVHPPSPPQQQGDVASKLHLTNLKAAVQNVGLDTGSIGWAILEKLVLESDATEWAELLAAVTPGKATLLLPLEQTSSNQSITPEFVKDHIVIYDGPMRKNVQMITLSGLRGILDHDVLTFRSSIHTSSKIFQGLLNPTTRRAALSNLPELPLPVSSTHQPSTPYPAFTLPSHTSSLPLPPRPPTSLPVKPSLPPRPSHRSVSSPATSNAPISTPPPTSRLSNTFASLFGGGGNSSLPKVPTISTPVPAPSPIPPPAPASPAASPPASLHSVDSYTQSSTPQPDGAVIDVSAFTISRQIVRKDVGKEMNKALRQEIRDSLTSAHANGALPVWVIDRVHEFTARWYPVVKDVEPVPGKKKTGLGASDNGNEGGRNGVYTVNRLTETPENAAAMLQEFYLGLEQDVRIGGPSFWGEGNGEETEKNDIEEGEGKEDEDERRVRYKIDNEARIKEVMDVVERTICSLFYDRLYMQPTSDDASHDETLSSRVAALNMLDLGLEHLDIHVGDAGPELDLVVRACGEMLTQLDACRSPGDKAAILVAAHKILVDGLSRLPPIRLMSDEESKAQKAKASSVIENSRADAPPRDLEGKLRIMTPMVSHRALEVQSPEAETNVPAHKQDEGDLKTASQTSPIPPITVSESKHEPELEPETDKNASSLRSPTAPPRSPLASPVLTMSPLPIEATPVSGDVLLPMIIFSVVKTNPPHLVSNLLYTQRFRNQSVGGEESYCLINLMAVAEFLENVDLAALGLGDSDKVMSAADLTPIPLNRSPSTPETSLAAVDGIPVSLRGRVEQANKVLTDVVDTSFGMLRSLLPTANAGAASKLESGPLASVDVTSNSVKPGFGLLRRETGFSIKNITAALPMPISRGTKSGEEVGQQLVAVSRPGSIKSARGEDGSGMDEESEEEDDSDEEEDEEEEVFESSASAFGDTKSIRSFESMLSGKGMKGKSKKSGGGKRKSLSDRFAHMSGLAGLKGSPPTSRPTSLLPHPPAESHPGLLMPLCLAPPIQHFVECTPGDLRLSEVGELLRDYRRLVEGIQAVGGFES